MNEHDKRRIEDAIWTLFVYRNEIEEMHSELKLDRHELESVFKTLHYVYGNVSK